MVLDSNLIIENTQKTINYDISACSGIGRRESQQDYAYYYADEQMVYAVVCDGMGGLGGGELASRAAAETVRQHFIDEQISDQNKSISNNEWMLNAILDADRKVYEIRNEQGKRLGSGSTIVSVWIKGKKLYWASAGDSRIYIIRNGEIVQATTDLNYLHLLNQKRESGSMSEPEYEKELESGEALISFLGLGSLDMIDRNTEAFDLQKGDIVVLCTDGLYRTIDDAWMADIVTVCEIMSDVAEYVPMIISEHGSSIQDNFTGIFIKII